MDSCTDRERILIFDTTLRDGQQCPGAGMDLEENLKYAELAAKLKVDVLEAGFPAASRADFQIVNEITQLYASIDDAPIVAALCQLRSDQIDITIEALQPAIENDQIARLHVYVPVDPALMSASLGQLAEDKAKIVEMVGEYVARAAAAGLQVQFSPEGYSRQGENFSFTTDVIMAAVENGATIINCPDTIGSACSYEGEHYFVKSIEQHEKLVRRQFPEKHITWSVHCHNDFGLAVINSINGVLQGPARQIEGCINGVGERAGNASLEQCIMILKHFGDKFYTRACTEYIQEISDFVDLHMLPRQPHTPICGDNSARHTSGGHTNAILKNLHAYQPFDPKETGNEVSFVFGPLSGGNHAKSIIENAGYCCPDHEKAEIAQYVKNRFAERRKGITDQELVDAYIAYRQPISITSFDYSRTSDESVVFLDGHFFGTEGKFTHAHKGRDSALAALKSAIDEHMPGYNILKHQSHSEGKGIQAKSVSLVIVTDELGNEYSGKGKDRDIEISAMKALIDAMNRAYVYSNYQLKAV